MSNDGEKKIEVRLDPAHYEADACIVWCFDNRFWHALERLVETKGLKHFDPITVASGAKLLAANHNETHQFVLEQIRTSVRLHRSKEIILMTHNDCGAYGGGLKSMGGDAETFRARCLGDMAAAKHLVQKEFPDAKISTIFADFDGLIET